MMGPNQIANNETNSCIRNSNVQETPQNKSEDFHESGPSKRENQG